MNKNKVILITGASGFLGTWLAEEAFNSGYKLLGVDLRSPLNPTIWFKFATASCENIDWNTLIGNDCIHAVCHLAGGASVAASVKDPYGDFASLLPGTARLSTYLTKNQPQARIFLFSSAAVYGNPIHLPINESTEINPISPYGIHKYLAESLLLNYSRVLGLGVTVFRIFSIYGIGLRKQLIWDVANKAIDAAEKGEKVITLFGTGNETRDFIYVEDLCKAVMELVNIHSTNDIQIYNMASGNETSIKEVANILIKYLELNVSIEFDGKSPVGDPLNWQSDISKLKAAIDFKPMNSLDAGLKKVALWIKEIK